MIERLLDLALQLLGISLLVGVINVQTSVEIVKPGGTGRPRFAISARFAPLPPSRLRMSAAPSAAPSPKV
jgi:hypothetical protein